MTALETLIPGARVRGVLPDRSVVIVQVEWHGDHAVTLTHRDEDGRVDQDLLYRSDEARLALDDVDGPSWLFDADGETFRLASEALRIHLAHLFDPYLAVHTSNLDPLPHQIRAVYGEMLPRHPLRFVLADDPGAGKTIMAGLLVKELIVRGDVQRCLVVAPGSLVEQWQDELATKLGLEFSIITREMIEASRTGNPFADTDLAIARLDQLARRDELRAKLEATDWDLVVVDEAHKMSAHFFGFEVKKTKRYELGELLGRISRHLLLMTATPHSGKPEDFQLFMALVDPDRFEGRPRAGTSALDAQGLMRRMVKEELLTFDGKPLFPERRAYTVTYALSPEEARLYEEVTEYVRQEMNRADRLKEEGEGGRGNIVGFALTVLQRRLASSPEAIYQSLVRRRNRLELRLNEEQQRRKAGVGQVRPILPDVEAPDDFDDLPDAELEELEDRVVDQASAARTVAELQLEIETLERLSSLAEKVRRSGKDAKWARMSELLQDPSAEMFDASGRRRKIIVFSEHRDTLNYLTAKMRSMVGRSDAVVEIHGGMSREARRAAQEAFRQDPDVVVLVATDAAGEGVNLQRAHLLVNYDLPWNPNRIEQRFGRIHRIGQTEVCHMWNLVAGGTREGDVFGRLLEKLAASSEELGGRVFDVLGDQIFDEPLRDLLLEAVRYGDRPEVKARLDEVVDTAVGDKLRAALVERRLLTETMNLADVDEIRHQMELADARRLQPHYIRSFFLEAFRALGGRMAKRETGRFEITHVPAELRRWETSSSAGRPVVQKYERVAFEKGALGQRTSTSAELLAPGHPLVDATVGVLLARHRELLQRGAVLVDEGDPGQTPRVLVYIEHSIQNAREGRNGQRQVVSKRLQFVEVAGDGSARDAGYAPYLDYRPLAPGEAARVASTLQEGWIQAGPEAIGIKHAITEIVPAHLADVREQVEDRVDLTKEAVQRRLTHEIVHWDHRANELKQQELAGKQPRMNSGRARQRADDLTARLAVRIRELDQERQLSPLPPVVIGGAVIIPRGLLESGAPTDGASVSLFAADRDRTERLAVDGVLAAERALGRNPVEQARNNPGFDILSRPQDDGPSLFIEVKGRVAGAETFTITRNEVLHALNKGTDYILALVAVSPDDSVDIRYVREPFSGSSEVLFGVTSVIMNWDQMFDRGSPPS